MLSHNFQTTTILYYTFFLPGVILHEVIYWLVAGVLNVRAEGAIKWPEQQEIGELKLNFVEIDRRASSLRKALITAAPLAAGIAIIWLIANNVLDIQGSLATMQSGTLESVWAGIQQLTRTPDFWLWIYLVFAISNTMFPTIPKNMQGWRLIIGILFALILAASAIGIGSSLFETLSPAVTTFLSVVQAVLVLMMCVNVLVVLVLGTIEAIVERITGHSATFKRGKMITMTREEAIAERQKERDRERRRIEREKARREADAAYASIYSIVFPIPGAPGDVPVTQPEQLILGLEGDEEKPSPLDRPRRSADTIEGKASRSLPGGVEPTVSFDEPDEPEVIIPEPGEEDHDYDEEPAASVTSAAEDRAGEYDEHEEEDDGSFVLQVDAERKSPSPTAKSQHEDIAAPEEAEETQAGESHNEDDSVEDVLAALNAADMFADDEDDDEPQEEAEADSSSYTSSLNIASEKVDRDRIFNTSPFSKPPPRPNRTHADDDEYEDEAGDTARRSRGSDSVRDLFASFNDDENDEEDVSNDEPLTSGRFRLGKIIQPPSTSAGSSRPVPKSSPQPTESDEAEDGDDYDELTYEEDDDIDYYIDDD